MASNIGDVLRQRLEEALMIMNADRPNTNITAMINDIVHYDKSNLWAMVAEVDGAYSSFGEDQSNNFMRINDFLYMVPEPALGLIRTVADYYGFKASGKQFFYVVGVHLFDNPINDILAPDVVNLIEYQLSSSNEHISSFEYVSWMTLLLNKPIRDDIVSKLNQYAPGNKLAQLIQHYGSQVDGAFAKFNDAMKIGTYVSGETYKEVNAYLGGGE